MANLEKEKKSVKPIKVILQWLLILAAVFIFFEVKNALIGEDEPKQTSSSEQTETVEKVPEKEIPKGETHQATEKTKGIDSFVFRTFASGISGKTFMKEVSATENKGVITFYNDYSEYKQENPDSQVTEEEYKLYFTSGDGLEKTLFEATAYLFNKIPEMQQLSVTLPFEGKVYSYDVDRVQINSYIGKDKADDNLRKQFMNSIVTMK